MPLYNSDINYYIEKLKDKLKDHPRRFNHSLGVLKMASFLAKKNDVDEFKAEVAAILHDYGKYDELDYHTFLDEEKAKLLDRFEFLRHGYYSAYLVTKEFGILDEDILDAIRNHSVGYVGMPMLTKIILLSDYIEENRSYIDCVNCRNMILNGASVDEALVYMYEKNYEYLKKNDLPVYDEKLEIARSLKNGKA